MMIPAGYMSKRVSPRPGWIKAPNVEDICSVSGCVSKEFAEYINYWKHNGYWLFNSPRDILEVVIDKGIDICETTMFYYEVFYREFCEETRQWSQFEPEASFATNVEEPHHRKFVGYDVVTFFVHNSPECSPLSCNGLASNAAVNRHCLLDTFEEAVRGLEAGVFDDSEPGPFRIFAVYTVDTPKSD